MAKLDFLIIGAQKAGTSSLRAFFRENSEFFRIPTREMQFWNRSMNFKDGAGIKEYLQILEGGQPGKLAGEKTPNYLNSKDAPKRLKKYFPDTKLIAILRNPIDRAYSSYWHGRKNGAIPENMSFSELIRLDHKDSELPFHSVVERGFYDKHLAYWLRHFHSDQFSVLEHEDVITNQESRLRDLAKFLELSDSQIFRLKLTFPHVNRAKQNRFPRLTRAIYNSHFLDYKRRVKLISKITFEKEYKEMEQADRRYLERVYSDHVTNLESILGRELQWT
ncbi:MAG TPA: sulfotransferase [Candidatus Nanopelagicaceae bacterium]|nr:sulfotransferase [Candidatus Nanopelagicaceae bacterium]